MTDERSRQADREEPMPFVCRHADPPCEEDPCPWGIARFLCNAPADHPARANQGDTHE